MSKKKKQLTFGKRVGQIAYVLLPLIVLGLFIAHRVGLFEFLFYGLSLVFSL